MGIYKYHKWISQKFPSCISNFSKMSKYNNVFIDLNYLLHLSMYGSINNEAFFDKLFLSLDYILKSCFIVDTLMISIDGTTPYSKIIVQKKRRLNNSKNINISNLSSLHLTPGTEFMNNIKNKILEYLDSRKKWFKFRKVKFIVSSSDESGEGEIKIIRRLRLLSKQNKNKTNLIIGNDADLVVIAMACISSGKIDIMVNNFNNKRIIKINKIASIYSKQLFNKKMNVKKLRLDFSLISIMMGNDYLPKIAYIKYDMLWESYESIIKTSKKFIIDKNKFNNKVLISFITSVILKLKPRYQKINLKNYDENRIKKYLEGLLWCISMYRTGNCSMIDYIYTYKSPTPVELLYYLEFNCEYVIQTPITDVNPIPECIYPLLLMPKKARKLVPKKYNSLIDTKLKYLYEVEDCSICNSFSTNLGKLNKKIKFYEDDFEFDEAKDEIRDMNEKYKNHKKTHTHDFSIKDINYVISLK